MGLIEIAQHLIGIAESHAGVGGGKNLRMEGERAGVGAERRFGQVRYAGADGVHGVGTLAKGVGEIGFNLDAPVAALDFLQGGFQHTGGVRGQMQDLMLLCRRNA